jgi:hypothetical protein
MRKVLALGALSLFVVVLNVSAAPVRDAPRGEPSFGKIIRIMKKAVRSLGDALVLPRP